MIQNGKVADRWIQRKKRIEKGKQVDRCQTIIDEKERETDRQTDGDEIRQ